MNELSSFLELLAILIMDPRSGSLIGLLAVAAVIDCRTYRIPNWLTMSGAAFALAYAVAVPFAPKLGFFWALGGFALGLFMFLPLYMIKVMGAGDVKLMAMAGAFLGVSDTFYAILCTFIVGGIAALGFALLHGVLGRMLGNIKTDLQSILLQAAGGVRPVSMLDASKSVGKLPYGASISIGTIGYVVAKQLGYL